MSGNEKKPVDLLKDLERTLRGYIRFKLSLDDHSWWKKRVPGGVKTKCDRRKQDHEQQWPWEIPKESHPISFADIDDYATIIKNRRNWPEIFAENLGDKQILLGKLRELELARHAIAHSRPFPKDAESDFRTNVAYLLKLLDADPQFKRFQISIGEDWEDLVESCREEDVILILAGNPWLLNQDTQFKERNTKLDRKWPDLLFEKDDGFKTYVEVKRHQLDLKQIHSYASLLREKHSQKGYKLIWFIPESLKKGLKQSDLASLKKGKVMIITYDIGFFTRWSFLRAQSRSFLDTFNRALSEKFRYTMGRKTHETFHYDFRNVCDALYFYGYIERDGKKSKTGFHLATLGWNLDLFRNLTSSNFRFMETNPELVLKLVVELLEYPYLYKDPKATPRQAMRPMGVVERGGFATFLENYIKKGRIEDIKELVKSNHKTIRDLYDRRLVPLINELKGRYSLSDPLLDLQRVDILDFIATQVAKLSVTMNTLPAGAFRDGVIKFLRIKETELTAEIDVRGQIVRNTRVNEKGTYKANMAKRLVELMSLKRILNVHSYIVPTYEILSFVKDTPRKQGVQTFKLNKNARLRRSYLRNEND